MSIAIERLSVVSGSWSPFMPSAFGPKVENDSGSWVSGWQRITVWPRVHPELKTLRRSAFFVMSSSASSIAKVGCHLAIDRNSAAPEISTLFNARRTRKEMTPSSVLLPESRSTERASKVGL